MENVHTFFFMTPREIGWVLTAFRARQQRRQQEIWLMGKYTALAVHDPAHFPPPPSFFSSGGEMTENEMKRRLLALRGKEDQKET